MPTAASPASRLPQSSPVSSLTPATPIVGAPNGDAPTEPRVPLILVVDDEEGNRYAIARWLTAAGFRVVQAATGVDALARAADGVDLVVLDVVLPDIHGFEVARRLKLDARTAHLPVLHLSAARVSTADRVEGLETGADAYLTHPVVPEELIAIVRALLRLSRVERTLREPNAILHAPTREAERARAEAERATSHRTRLQAATAALARVDDAEDVAAAILAEVAAAVDAAASAVFAFDAGGSRDVFMRIGACGFDAAPLSAAEVARLVAEGLAAEALRSGSAVWIESPEELDARYPALADATIGVRFGAWAALPLRAGGEPLGALCLAFVGARALDASERALLSAFADQCAQALERAHLREGERAAGAERARLYDLEQRARTAAEDAFQEAQAANRAKTDFLAVMSHELRTPLNAIGGYAELIELGIRGPITDEQRADLGRMRAAQRYLLGLVSDVLNFVRVDSGHVEYRLEDLPVHAALASLEELIGPQFHARGVTYAPAPCDQTLRVRADRDKLQQILVNLLGNALKFTEPGGRVSLACEGHGDTATLHVTDTGVGIPAEKLGAVFEPFVQVGAARNARSHEGVGLGLAISRNLARGMGGDLTVQSTPGRGSTFVVTLPRV